jgi:hypothetical protein
MNSTDTRNVQNPEVQNSAADCAERRHGHRGHHGRGPREGFGPRPGFGPGHPAFAGPFAGGPRPKKGNIRLMKRVRRLAVALAAYRGTATKEQRAEAIATLDETIVEIKRILAS